MPRTKAQQRLLSSSETDPWKSANPQYQYGGEVFAAASDFARYYLPTTSYRRESTRLREDRRPRLADVAALLRVVRGLPRLQTHLTPTPAGAEIRRYLRANEHGIPYRRLAQGVLPLPDEFATYLRGRTRQAVRTNLNRASEMGFQTREIADENERRQIIAALAPTVAGMQKWAENLHARPDDVLWGCTQADGTPAGLALVTIDRECALLASLVATSSEARYCLHTAVVERLCEQGVRYLIVYDGCALMLAPGLQYLQRLLGYRVANLRVTPGGSGVTAA